MNVELTGDEVALILSCIETADMLFSSRKKENKELVNLKQKLSKIAPQERRRNILTDMLR